jgi:hypothetical protein
VDVVGADQPRLIGLGDGALERLALGDVLAADVDVAGMSVHREGGDQAPLDQEMRVMPHDLPVLAGARLRLVGVDHEVMRPSVRLLGHERPFEAGREPAPPRPRRPDFFISSMIQSRPLSMKNFVSSQRPRRRAASSPASGSRRGW